MVLDQVNGIGARLASHRDTEYRVVERHPPSRGLQGRELGTIDAPNRIPRRAGFQHAISRDLEILEDEAIGGRRKLVCRFRSNWAE
jgi:hypothetical protein